MKKSNIVLIISLYISNFIFSQINTTTSFDFIISEDGVWTWYNDERAIFKNDRLYTSYVKRDGKVALSVNDIKTGTNIGSETILSNWTQRDDHNNAALLSRLDGKIMAFFTPHTTTPYNYSRTSLVDEPTNQLDWSQQVAQNTINNAGYNNVYQLSAEGGKIYNFMRTSGKLPNFKEYTSDGTPIRNGKDILLFNRGGGGPPYVKYVSNNIDRIDMFVTDGHPRFANNNLYHCYYKTNNDGSQGSIYQTNGTLITTLASVISGTPIPIPSINKIYAFGSDGTQDRPWNHDINYDSNGNPVVSYSKQKNINEITYHYARWNGTNWTNNFVADAGNGLYNNEKDYTGLMTINPYNANEIFMSSNVNPISGIENNIHEIYSAITPDNGKTWQWTEITKNSAKDNLRPYVPKGISNSEDRVVIWFYGDYFSYTNYNTRVVGEYINKTYTGPDPDTGIINTNITYGIDINTNDNINLSPFKSMIGTTNASVNDNEVSFSLFGAISGARHRSGASNDLTSDFVFIDSPDATLGVKIVGLPEGKYTVNSFHYDQNYPTAVKVTLREQGGSQIGNEMFLNNVETPAKFQLSAKEGKIYEIIATENNSNNRLRFNGVSIIRNKNLNTVSFDDNYNNINIYPNPFSESLNIDSRTKITKVYLYNILGKLVKTITPNQNNKLIDISTIDIPSGIYFLRIKIQNKPKALSKRVIKK